MILPLIFYENRSKKFLFIPPEGVAHQSQGNDGVVFCLVPDVAGGQFHSHTQ